MKMKRFISESPACTAELAARVALQLQPGDVLAFAGDLGAGKTCFIQGLADALKITEPVTSPTYTLINEYQGSCPLYHMDLYRLSGPEEAFDLGFDDYLNGQGITVIEWAERAEELLPERTYALRFEHGDSIEQRIINIPEELLSC